MLNNYVVLIFVCFLFLGCFRQSPESINGTWLSGAYKMDINTYRPLSSILTFNDKQLVIKSNNKRDTMAYSLSKESLVLKESDTISLNKFKLKGNKLKWKQRYMLNFHKCIKSDLSLIEVEKKLLGNYWIHEGETILFKDDGYCLVSKDNNKNFMKFCYSIKQVDNYIILYKYGNLSDCSSNLQYLGQVVNIDKNKLRILRWEKDDFKTITYTSEKKTIKPKLANFQLCDIHLNRNYPNHRYYAVGTSYKGGLYQIQKEFKKSYISPKNIIESGLVRIGFVVNCLGEAGQFEMLELDSNYKEKKFNDAISNQILQITKELKGWTSGIKDGKQVDSFNFLTFKIKDSEIIEIFP